MKKFLIVLFFAAALVTAFAAYTKQNSRVERFQCDVVYAPDGTVAAVNVNAFLRSRFTNEADAADQVPAPTMTQVNFDLIDDSLNGQTITAATKTVTYKQLAALIRQASLDRANAAGVQ